MNTLKSIKYPILRQIVKSPQIDIFAAILIFGVSIAKNFHETVYQNGAMQFGVPIQELGTAVSNGAFPLGIVSVIAAIFSVLATRLVGKQNNWGNIIGVVTTISSGTIDYLFGNHSAIITYPITFLIHNLATYRWSQGAKIRKRDIWYWIIIGVGMAIGFGLVYLGAHLFGGKTDTAFLITVSLGFGLSLGGNFCNAFKYEETWLSWVVYNIINLIKNAMQLNIANVAKYVFYLFNAAVTLGDWKFNGDAKKKGVTA